MLYEQRFIVRAGRSELNKKHVDGGGLMLGVNRTSHFKGNITAGIPVQNTGSEVKYR